MRPDLARDGGDRLRREVGGERGAGGGGLVPDERLKLPVQDAVGVEVGVAGDLLDEEDAEGEEDADGREVLDATGGGGGLLYWPLLATIVALAVPVGHEFLCAGGGVPRTYQRWALDA